MKRFLRGSKRLGLVAMALFLAMALLLGSVVPAKAEPNERVVTTGILAAWTGALATETVPLHQGEVDHARWLNEQGGINGINVKVLWEDWGSVAARALTVYRRLAEAGAVAITCPVDLALDVAITRLIRDEIPAVYTSGSTAPQHVMRPVWIIGSGIEAENIYLETLLWMKKKWKEQTTEKRKFRVAIFHADMPIVNAVPDHIIPYINERTEELGVEVVGREKAPFIGVVDTSVELLRLAAKKPDLIMVAHYGATMVVIVKDAARLDLPAKGIMFSADIASLSDGIIRVAGKAAEGWYRNCDVTTMSDLGRPEAHMLPVIADAAKRYRGIGRPEDVDLAYIKGWRANAVVTEAVRIAIEAVGYENLTGRAVRDGFLRIKDFDMGVGPPVSISEERAYYGDTYFMQYVEKGELVRVSEWWKCPERFHYLPGGKMVVR